MITFPLSPEIVDLPLLPVPDPRFRVAVVPLLIVTELNRGFAKFVTPPTAASAAGKLTVPLALVTVPETKLVAAPPPVEGSPPTCSVRPLTEATMLESATTLVRLSVIGTPLASLVATLA